MVKAKFYVGNVAITSLNDENQPEHGTVHMYPVCRGSANKRWAQYSPSGHFEITTKGPALRWFYARIGKELSINIDGAEMDPATHEFSELEEEFVGYDADRQTCAECGYPREAHDS